MCSLVLILDGHAAQLTSHFAVRGDTGLVREFPGKFEKDAVGLHGCSPDSACISVVCGNTPIDKSASRTSTLGWSDSSIPPLRNQPTALVWRHVVFPRLCWALARPIARSPRMRIAFGIVRDDGIERTLNDCKRPYPSLDNDKRGPARAPCDFLIFGSRLGRSYALAVPRLSRRNRPGETERNSGNDHQHLLLTHGSLRRLNGAALLRPPMEGS